MQGRFQRMPCLHGRAVRSPAQVGFLGQIGQGSRCRWHTPRRPATSLEIPRVSLVSCASAGK
eukprot:7333207-Pyramimonas_sp.AAC.1